MGLLRKPVLPEPNPGLSEPISGDLQLAYELSWTLDSRAWHGGGACGLHHEVLSHACRPGCTHACS
jgi:hypothetical protein